MSKPNFRDLFTPSELTRIDRIGESAEKLSDVTAAINDHKKIVVKIEKKPDPPVKAKAPKAPKAPGAPPKPRGRPKRPVPVCVNCAGKSLMLPPPCIEKPVLVEYDPPDEPEPTPTVKPPIPEPEKVAELPPIAPQEQQVDAGKKSPESIDVIQVKQEPPPSRPTPPEKTLSLAQKFVLERGGTYGQFLRRS